MKRIHSLLLVIVMVLGLFAGCGNTQAPAAEQTADVAMQYITPEDAKGLLEDDAYVFFDIRKAADSSVITVPGALAYDMDAAKEGDAEAGKATMTEATKGLDKKIILVCYSGRRYAQAATNALSAIGYDMSKVYTLEGGFTAWSEKFPELAVAPGAAAVTPIEIDPQIHFCGSSSLAPIIASIGASYQEAYGTWDKVNPAFPAEEIDIAVTSGGSGDGPSSVLDGTADFGMLARSVKDSEKDALGAGYTEYMVASDALTISVNKDNPVAALMDDMDTDTIRKIFSGEITYWDELDPSLEHKEIVVIIRDLSGGAAEVFEKNVMQGTPISENAIQSPSMGALAAKIVENKYAIGYAGYGVYNQNIDSLYAFKVNGVEPTEENILNGSYTIQRPVLFVINRELDAAEAAFVDYIFSDTGRSIVVENGYIPVF
ncbi:MAG: substrate-binding domain-containing protein [Faecousia sp.]